MKSLKNAKASMNRKIKRGKRALMTIFVLLFALLAIMRGVNMAQNNNEISNSSYKLASFATGINGHTDFIRYSNEASDVNIYHGFSTSHYYSESYYDIDGNKHVDKIIRYKKRWFMVRLEEILLRDLDYQMRKRDFDDADEILQELIVKYDPDSSADNSSMEWIEDVKKSESGEAIRYLTIENSKNDPPGSQYLVGPSKSGKPDKVGIYFHDSSGN